MTDIKQIFYSSSVIIALIFTIFLSGCGLTDTPENTTKKFLSLLETGQYLEAQDRLSSDFRQMAVRVGGIKNENLRPYYRSDNMADYEILDIQKSEGSARIDVQLTTRDGQTHRDEIFLIKENKEWKIERF